MEHTIDISRRTLGRGPLKGDGLRYGTNVRCSCTQWDTYTNEFPPSKGGNKWAQKRHQEHVESTTVESDVNLGLYLLKKAQERLSVAIEKEDRFVIGATAAAIHRRGTVLVEDLRTREEQQNQD
jgi:hypothetical protein